MMDAEKKKIIIIMNNLNVGGAEKSLISLLNTFDYDRYCIDLQLFRNRGMFLKRLPAAVNLLPQIEEYGYFDMPFFKALSAAAKKGRFDIVKNRILAVRIFRNRDYDTVKEQKVWKYIGAGIPKSQKKYDAVIGFLEKSPIYYAVEKVDARIKIGFIHNDYEELKMDPKFDRKYFRALDYIVTDSRGCKAKLVKNFPSEKNKIKIIYNIVSQNLVEQLSEEKVGEHFPSKFKIVSIGRLEHQKGYDLAVDALKIIRDQGIDFHWIILGEGVLKDNLVKQIKRNGIEDHVSFCGIKENHYPYIKLADVFMQTSRFEGKSIAIDEAKILAKPILVTRFSTVQDQIEDQLTGIIAEMNPESIAEKLQMMIKDKNLLSSLSKNLRKNDYTTESEIIKIEKLLGENRKKLLFVVNSMEVGGAEKALISVLQLFDYAKYRVDLQLFKKEGLFLKQIPEEVNILDIPSNYRFFDMPFIRVIRENFVHGKWNNIYRRIQFKWATLFAHNPAEAEQISWKPLSHTLKPIVQIYDAAIGFLEKNPNYFVAEKVQAALKMGWIQNEYVKLGMNSKLDAEFLKPLSFIIANSETSVLQLKELFPQFISKIKKIENIITPDIIRRLGNEEVKDFDFSVPTFTSAGRLAYQKGFDLGMDAAKMLHDKGIDFRWLIMGAGEERDELQSQIQTLGLQNKVMLIGIKENPYAYINKSLFYFHPSRFEGKSVVVDEVKCLCKPILLTNFQTAKDQITHMENGYVCGQDVRSVAAALELFITSSDVRQKFAGKLSDEDWGTEKEIQKLYQLIENE